MAALAQETAELAARVAEECKSLRTLINANSPDLSSLNTSSTNNLVAAVNEVWTITQSGIEWDNIQSKPSTFAPSAHTHPASEISDSTTTGRSLMTAANASSARTTLGLGNAALATTSTGGNGAADSGKVLAFDFDGSIKTTKVTVQSSSGLTGLVLNPPTSSVAAPTFVAGSYTVATTQSAFGIPDNLVVSSTKTTPVDADSVLMTDSAAIGTPAKRVTFANLWTWITTKLGGNLTIGGTKTWSGQQEATGQSATNGTSLMTRDLGDTRFLLIQMTGAYRWSNTVGTYTASNVGTGASSSYTDILEFNSGATAGSVAFLRSNSSNVRSWHRGTGTSRSVVDWSLRTIHCVRIAITQISLSGTDTVARIMLGQVYTNTTAQDLAASDKGIGLKIIDRVLNVQVANATAVSTTSTGQTLSNQREYDIVLDCDGNGNWNCYVNGVSVAAGTGAPTGNSTSGNNALCMSITNGTTAASRQFLIIQQTSIQF